MSIRNEPASYENMVVDALERMRTALQSAPQYEVDRTGSHWVVRREPTAETLFPSEAVSAALNQASG